MGETMVLRKNKIAVKRDTAKYVRLMYTGTEQLQFPSLVFI